MVLPLITALPAAPNRGMDATTFATTADAFLSALVTYRTELQAFGNALVTAASASNYDTTSNTSNSIATGSKTFTVETGKLFVVGTYVIVAQTSAPTNWMVGQVTAYNILTGSLTVGVVVTNGSGTITDWTISLCGPKGADAAGWSTITTINTTSGTTADFLNIPTTYNDLMFVFNGVSHNSGSASSILLNLSNDGGSSFGSGTTIGATSQASTVTWYGGVYVPAYMQTAGVMETALENLTTEASYNAGTGLSRPWRCSNGFRSVRFGLVLGSFDAGSITLKGR